MKQSSFSDLAYEHKKKTTRKERFLAGMEAILPWDELLKPIMKKYPKAGQGRRPVPAEVMLRIYFLQQWYGLSEPGCQCRCKTPHVNAELKFPSLWVVAGHYDLLNFTPLRMLSAWFQPTEVSDVITWERVFMLHELHAQGVSINAIARQTGLDRKAGRGKWLTLTRTDRLIGRVTGPGWNMPLVWLSTCRGIGRCVIGAWRRMRRRCLPCLPWRISTWSGGSWP